MSRATRRLTESEARGVLRQLIDGLLYLGRQRVIHRDIKADNILLTEDMRLVRCLVVHNAGFQLWYHSHRN